MKITYTKEILEQMRLFIKVTRTLLKDCFEYDGVLYFVVEPGEIGKAIGKHGRVVQELQQKLNRKIKLVEFSPELAVFIANFISPLKPESIAEAEGKITIRSSEREIRAQLIGRNAKNLNMLQDVAKRYFNVSEIIVE